MFTGFPLPRQQRSVITIMQQGNIRNGDISLDSTGIKAIWITVVHLSVPLSKSLPCSFFSVCWLSRKCRAHCGEHPFYVCTMRQAPGAAPMSSISALTWRRLPENCCVLRKAEKKNGLIAFSFFFFIPHWNNFSAVYLLLCGSICDPPFVLPTSKPPRSCTPS